MSCNGTAEAETTVIVGETGGSVAACEPTACERATCEPAACGPVACDSSAPAAPAASSVPAASSAPDPKVDRRILKTRAAIQTAFRRLVTEQGLNKVTVSSLAREANIDRKTFYLHYESIDDLLDNEIEQLMTRVVGCIDVGRLLEAPRAQIRRAFDEVNAIISEDLELYRYVAGNLSIDFTIDRIARAVARLVQKHPVQTAAANGERVIYLVRFFLVGAVSVYGSWLRSDHRIPLSQIADLVTDAFYNGLHEVLAGKASAAGAVATEALPTPA